MNPRIELRHLRYFLAVADAETFTHAARRLGISQPSLSQQIKDLETMLGTPLFRRLGKRLQLTEAAIAFRASAGSIVRRLEEACAAVAGVAGAQAGHLEIGVVPGANLAWIPAAIERMAAEHAGVTVTVHERSASAIETELEAGRFDLGLGVLTHASPNLRYERLLSESITLIVPRGHALAGRASVSVNELESIKLVLLPRSFDTRQIVDDVFRRSRVRPLVAYEVSSISSTLAVVRRSGVATLLTPIVLAGGESLDLRAIPLRGKVPRIDYGLTSPRGSELSPAAQAFAAAMHEVSRARR